MLRVMKGFSQGIEQIVEHIVYNKHTKTMMESINVVINDTISEKDIDGDGDGDEPNLKKNEGDDNMS